MTRAVANTKTNRGTCLSHEFCFCCSWDSHRKQAKCLGREFTSNHEHAPVIIFFMDITNVQCYNFFGSVPGNRKTYLYFRNSTDSPCPLFSLKIENVTRQSNFRQLTNQTLLLPKLKSSKKCRHFSHIVIIYREQCEKYWILSRNSQFRLPQ